MRVLLGAAARVQQFVVTSPSMAFRRTKGDSHSKSRLFSVLRAGSALRDGLGGKLSASLGVTHCHLIARLKGSQSRCSLLHDAEGHLLSLSIYHQGLRGAVCCDHLTGNRLRRSRSKG